MEDEPTELCGGIPSNATDKEDSTAEDLVGDEDTETEMNQMKRDQKRKNLNLKKSLEDGDKARQILQSLKSIILSLEHLLS